MLLPRDLLGKDNPEGLLWQGSCRCDDLGSVPGANPWGWPYPADALELARAPNWLWGRLKPKIMGKTSPAALKNSERTQQAAYVSQLLESSPKTVCLQPQLRFKYRFLPSASSRC